MKAITNDYKTGIKEFGRDIDSKIIYGLTVLGKEDLNSVTPHYESSLLKSVMKQLDIDSNVEIPVGTVVNYQFGLNVNGSYEYVDFGNYVVYKVEKQEDTNSWKITCYDKMLYSMKPYESLGVNYPITIRNYINALCNKIGLTFANVNSGFVNSEKEIQSELYLDSDGNSLDYTYRDVLDELAGATASTICINDNDELEIRYINDTGEKETETGTSLTLQDVESTKIDYELEGNTSQNGTPTLTSPIAVQTVKGTQNIIVSDGETTKQYAINLGNVELCKIGTYQDFIKKSIGKNVFKPKADNREHNGITCSYDETTQIYTFNGTCDTDNTIFNINDNEISFISGKTKSTTYWVGGSCTNYCRMRHFNDDYGIGSTYSIVDLSSNNTKITETSSVTFQCSRGKTSVRFNQGSVATDFKIKLMVSSETNTDFEPYMEDWYIEKNTEKYVFDGEESWVKSSNTSVDRFYINGFKTAHNISELGYSNYFNKVLDTSTTVDVMWLSGNQFVVNYSSYGTTTLSDFKTWVGNNNFYLYYALTSPQYIQITNEDLLKQLNSIRLLYGINTILVSSSNLSSPLTISYTTNMDTIDEEYLKNVNVAFGEKFGPVNSVVFSRSAESDNIYERDEESVEQNGLCEIKIKDNQILNGNNRDTFLSEVFNKLYGIEYYINDFSSTGLTFYDLLDRYKIKVGDNYYRCVMFNDEVDITQGLEEQVHTDMPEESQTDYTKSDKTDRRINQTYLIVDKQNQQISAVVQNVSQQMETIGTSLTQTIDSLNASVTSIQGTLDNGVSLVKTTSVTIDDSGLNVSTDTSKISTTMSNNSFEIKSGGTTLAYFGYDENDNTQKSQMDNLTVTNYLVAGNHRIEKYKTNRTGVFYIGG